MLGANALQVIHSGSWCWNFGVWLGVSTPYLVMFLFGIYISYFYSYSPLVCNPHHHELVRPRLGRDFSTHGACYVPFIVSLTRTRTATV